MINIFNEALKFVLAREGGYVNNPSDHGGATDFGITQLTYNNYRKNHKLSLQSVKNISQQEISNIYYNEYWIASGCDKLELQLAVVVFDTSVNMGINESKEFLKQCNGNINKYLQLRQEKYNQFAQVPSQKQFLKGWTNRINLLKNFIYKLNT